MGVALAEKNAIATQAVASVGNLMMIGQRGWSAVVWRPVSFPALRKAPLSSLLEHHWRLLSMPLQVGSGHATLDLAITSWSESGSERRQQLLLCFRVAHP